MTRILILAGLLLAAAPALAQTQPATGQPNGPATTAPPPKSPALANTPGPTTMPPDMPMDTATPHRPLTGAFVPAGPSTEGYNDAMQKMMADMGKPYTGDPDTDFVTHMIPHHQGAIDMAEIELKYGHDRTLKQLAAKIISAQQHEIGQMQSWLEKHPAKPAGANIKPYAR